MSGFDDLIAAALPYLATETIKATTGTTWQWEYKVEDGAGTPVDMTSGYTATLSIRDSGYTEILAATITFPSAGVIRCKVIPTANDTEIPVGVYLHELTVTRTSDSAKVVVVGAGGGSFTVIRKVS